MSKYHIILIIRAFGGMRRKPSRDIEIYHNADLEKWMKNIDESDEMQIQRIIYRT